MRSEDVAIMSPWKTLWDARLRRSSALMIAGLAVAIGFHRTIFDQFRWWEAASSVVLLEILILLVGDHDAPLPSAAALSWLRGVGQRMMADGALASLTSLALLMPLTRPVATPLLIGLLAMGGGGSFAVIIGASLVYWSYPRVRRWNRAPQASPAFGAVVIILGLGWAGYEVVARIQRTGAWESARLVGLALLVAGSAVAFLNPPTPPGEGATES